MVLCKNPDFALALKVPGHWKHDPGIQVKWIRPCKHWSSQPPAELTSNGRNPCMGVLVQRFKLPPWNHVMLSIKLLTSWQKNCQPVRNCWQHSYSQGIDLPDLESWFTLIRTAGASSNNWQIWIWPKLLPSLPYLKNTSGFHWLNPRIRQGQGWNVGQHSRQKSTYSHKKTCETVICDRCDFRRHICKKHKGEVNWVKVGMSNGSPADIYLPSNPFTQTLKERTCPPIRRPFGPTICSDNTVSAV